MRRKLDFIIDENTDGKSIGDFLKSRGFSGNSIIRLKQTENGILLNDRKEHVNVTVHKGDRLTVQTGLEKPSEKIIPEDLPFPVVYEDEDLVVVNKPAGMPVHPSVNHHTHTLAGAAAFYFKKKGEPFVFRCVNRLDMGTSGLVILAKHGYAAGCLNRQMEERKITKEYLAIVEGNVKEEKGKIDKPVGRLEGSVIERTVDCDRGERAVTFYEVEQRYEGYTLLRVRPETGRTHQIRVHMKSIGHPLAGDFLYNPGSTEMKRQALHACRLCFQHPVTKEKLNFEVEMPEDMKTFLSGLSQITVHKNEMTDAAGHYK